MTLSSAGEDNLFMFSCPLKPLGETVFFSIIVYLSDRDTFLDLFFTAGIYKGKRP